MNKGVNKNLIINIEDILNSSIVDEQDEKRIKKNIEFLEYNNLVNPNDIAFIPTNASCKLKSKNSIISKLLVAYTLATFSTYTLDNSSFLINATYEVLDKKFNIKNMLSRNEIMTIKKIVEHKLSIIELRSINSLYEEVYVLLWALGLIDKIESTKECDIKSINRVIFKVNDLNNLIEISKLRDQEEILEKADLITRLRYMDKNPIINRKVVEIQYSTFMWLISCDNNIQKVSCKLKDLKFSFEKRKDLKLERNDELFTLNNNDNSVCIDFYDLGNHNKKDYDSVVEDSVKEYIKEGYNIISDYALTSDKLSEKVKHFIIKNNEEVYSIYYVFISRHILKIRSLLNKHINYEDYNSLINTLNYNADIDIIMSIEKTDKNDYDDSLISNIYDFSYMIPSEKNINAIIDYLHSLYEKFYSLLMAKSNELKLEKTVVTGINIDILNNEYEMRSFSNYKEYKESMDDDLLNDVRIMEIEVNLCYVKDSITHNNTFRFNIKPYNIIFIRSSNYDEQSISIMEKHIVNFIDKLSKEKTIFNKNEDEN